MKPIRRVLSPLLAGVAAAMLIAWPAAHADDYSDVSRLAQSGKTTEALARADSYRATNPRDPQMRFIKAGIEADMGKTDEAIAAYTELTRDYPELPEPYNNLAALYAGRRVVCEGDCAGRRHPGQRRAQARGDPQPVPGKDAEADRDVHRDPAQAGHQGQRRRVGGGLSVKETAMKPIGEGRSRRTLLAAAVVAVARSEEHTSEL